MTRRVIGASLVALPITVGALLLFAATAFACTTDVPGVRETSDARGYTFVARVAQVVLANDPELAEQQTLTTLSVDRVFAGHVPESLVIYTDVCHELRALTPSAEYLFSTANLEEMTQYNTLAWRVRGDRLEFLGGEDFDSPPEVLAVKTMADALELMAGVGAEVPDTSTDAGRKGAADSRLVVILIAGGIASALTVRGLHGHRIRRAAPG